MRQGLFEQHVIQITHYALINCLGHNLYKNAHLDIPDSRPAEHLRHNLLTDFLHFLRPSTK